jgi:hypothetical protein
MDENIEIALAQSLTKGCVTEEEFEQINSRIPQGFRLRYCRMLCEVMGVEFVSASQPIHEFRRRCRNRDIPLPKYINEMRAFIDRMQTALK